MSTILIMFVLLIDMKVTLATERLECDSFYDYVCRNDETSSKSANSSYFEILGRKNEEIIEEVLADGPFKQAYDACLLQFWDSSVFLNSLTYYPNKKRTNDKRSSVSYRSFKTVSALKEQNTGSEFPFIISMTKKLNEDEFCIDLSPNTEWINLAKLASGYIKEISFKDHRNSVLPELQKAEFFVVSVINRLLKIYDKVTATLDYDRKMENEGANDEDSNLFLKSYILRYSTLRESLKKKSINPFLADVITSLYDIKSENFCIHSNGYEEFFFFLSQRIDSSFLDLVDQETMRELTIDTDSERDYLAALETVDLLMDFSKDLTFGRLSQKKPIMQIKIQKCKALLSTMFTGAVNNRYLETFVLQEDENLNRDALGESVIDMIENLKNTMKGLIYNSTHLPFNFKQFALSKLESMRTYVLTKRPNIQSLQLIEKNGVTCLNNFNRPSRRVPPSTWNDLMTCVALYKSDLEIKSFKKYKTGPTETCTTDYETRYAYLYETTDASIVNAWYDPTRNEITVPSGIISSPIYVGNFKGGSDMFDLSRMGMILGHELGHSLDVNGLCWDQHGNFDISEAFCAKKNQPYLVKSNVRCLEKDYGHPCNFNDDYGRHTVGEDIADQLGLITAYTLFLDKYEDQLRLEDKRDFFRKYALLWCDGKHPLSLHAVEATAEATFSHYGLSLLKRKRKNKSRNTHGEEGKEIAYASWVCDKVKNDVHALPQHRVNKTLRQIADFGSLFQCQPKDGMMKEKKCLIY